MQKTQLFWWLFPASLVVLFVYLLYLLYNISIRRSSTSSSISVELRQIRNSARLVFENPDHADLFGKMIAVMTQQMGYYSAFALGCLIKFIDAKYEDVEDQLSAMAIALFAVLTLICIIINTEILRRASFIINTPVEQLIIQDPEKYVESLMVLGFVLGNVVYHLCYYIIALLVGLFLGPIMMLLATLVLFLFLHIQDSYPLMRLRQLPAPAPLPREDPVVPYISTTIAAAIADSRTSCSLRFVA